MISVFRQTLSASKKALLWTLFFLLALLVLLLLFPREEITRLALPETLVRELSQAQGWLGRLGFVILFPLVLSVFSARMGSRMIAGEIEGGTLGLLLAQPLLRRSLLFAKAAAFLVMLTILVAALGSGILLGNWAFNVGIRLDHLPAALIGLWLYALLPGAVALLIGCLGASARLSFALGVILHLVWLGLTLLVYLPSAWTGWPYLSPLYALAIQNPLAEGLALYAPAILAGLAAGALLLAWWVFERRDLEI